MISAAVTAEGKPGKEDCMFFLKRQLVPWSCRPVILRRWCYFSSHFRLCLKGKGCNCHPGQCGLACPEMATCPQPWSSDLHLAFLPLSCSFSFLFVALLIHLKHHPLIVLSPQLLFSPLSLTIPPPSSLFLPILLPLIVTLHLFIPSSSSSS